MKKALPVIAAAVAVLLIAGLTVLMWYVEDRDTEDFSVAELRQKEADAQRAASVLPLLDRLEALTAELGAQPPGSPGYEAASLKIAEVSNLLASQMPFLAAGRDERGNVALIPLEEARRRLTEMVGRRPD